MAYIEFNKVSKTYQMGEVEIKAVNEVSFEIEKGEFVVILGQSGAGKTTMLNMLGGMDVPTSGKITVASKRVDKFNKKQLVEYRRHDIGFVFQFYNLIPNLTTLENVELACQLSKDALEPRVILELVGLDHRIKNFPSQLSGGEQQRVVIARAIANNPKLLICDEPTGNLDPDTSMEIMRVLKNINNLGTTVIMATHDREIVRKMNERVILIEDGRLKKDYEKGTYYNERY